MKQSYDNPLVLSYSFGIHDFGSGGDALAIKRPALGRDGRLATQCRIMAIHVAATETFNAVTTAGRIEVGTASDSDKFAEKSLGTLADTNGLDITDPETELFDNGYGGRGVILLDESGENIDQLEVTFVAPTGGTPAGQGYVMIAVAWW